MTLIIFLRFSKVLSHSFCFCRHSNNEPQIFFERQHLNVCHLDLLTTPGQLQNIHDYDHWHIVIILFIGTSFMNPRPAMLDCPIINTLFIQHLHNFRFFQVKKDVPFCVIGNSRKFPITREIALSSQFTHYANCNPISHNLIISQLYYLRLSIYSQILSSNRQNGQRLPIH